MNSKKSIWFKVLNDKEQIPENRVMTVTAGTHEVCLAHYNGTISALDNKCPHQGGPLGEGSIENGLLRCPWHGWDYHPNTGKAPGFDDGVEIYPIKIETDGIYVGLPEIKSDKYTISDLMVETMVNWGVNVVFGMVGHSNLGLADAFRRKQEEGKIRYFGIRHEGAASFAASAYGKLTGKPAACFAIAGPGSTNMYTGLWDAKVDRAPILALTGQVATQVVGTGNFQEVDLIQAFQSVADFNHRVQRDSKHGELMGLAIKKAILNRDVSHLTFPDEIQGLPSDPNGAQTPTGRMPDLGILPSMDSLENAFHAIKNAVKPVIVVGHGARFHMDSIIQFGEKLNCPIMTTFKAKGQISDLHPLGCGVLGRSGTPVASYFMNECDLIIALGTSFSNHTGITDKKTTIQVDFDPLTLAKFHKIDFPLLGEISKTMDWFNSRDEKFRAIDQQKIIASRWKIWRDEKSKRLKDNRGKGLSSVAVFDALTRLAPDNAVMCVDVGNNAYSFGRYFETKNQSFLMSGYLGSIGFALPAALGAWAAVENKRPIITVAGDGGFAQYMAEFTTAVKYNMNIKVILLNNNELAKISKEQRGIDLNVFETSLVNPGFADFANSIGGFGEKIDNINILDEAMTRILNLKGPALLEICSDAGLL